MKQFLTDFKFRLKVMHRKADLCFFTYISYLDSMMTATPSLYSSYMPAMSSVMVSSRKWFLQLISRKKIEKHIAFYIIICLFLYF